MSLYEKLQENRAITGTGSGLVYKNSSGKFSALIVSDKTPAVKGEDEEIEIPVTTSDTVGKIKGQAKLEKIEMEVYHHRDNQRRIEALKDKTLELMTYSSDGTGERFAGTVSYRVNEQENGNASKATVSIMPSAYYGYVDNIKPLMQPTAYPITAIPAEVTLPTTTGKIEIDNIEIAVEGSTFTAKSETDSIATVQASGKKLTITGVKEGSCIVELTTNNEKAAPWKTTILVNVPATVL